MPVEVLKPPRFPFSGIYGNASAKTAMLCAAVNPAIKAVLIRGPSGTAKTVLARAMPGIDPGKRVVNVPLNVTDEMLFGTIDIEKAIATGEIAMDDSLLQKANGNYLYVDDADLFDSRLLTAIIDAVMEGKVRVERENISAAYVVDTTLIASANSLRRGMGMRTMDCFDVVVTMRRTPGLKGAVEIAKRNMEFFEGTFSDGDFVAEDEELAKRIDAARKLLPKVRLTKESATQISRICKSLGVKGARGALSTARTAMTLAALAGRARVNAEDIADASLLCLDHRRTIKPKAEKKKPRALELGYNPLGGVRRFFHDDRGQNVETQIRDKINQGDAPEGADAISAGESLLAPDQMEDVIAKVGDAFEVIDLLEAEDSEGRLAGDDIAGRRYVESKDRKGKYIKSRIPESKNPDVAFDATVRAASPYQKGRRGPGDEKAVKLEKQDVREKVRQKNVTTTFLFLLDTSGSLIIRNRMSKVKAAMKAMLETHYVKRDRVGLMTFNEEGIDLVLAPTRAVEQLGPIVEKISVGQGTPLAEALTRVYEYMRPYVIKHPEERCHIVLITDGKATKAMEAGNDPVEEALEVAGNIYIPNVDWIVIDTGLGFTKNDIPKELAEALHGKFFLLDDLEKKEEARDVWD